MHRLVSFSLLLLAIAAVGLGHHISGVSIPEGHKVLIQQSWDIAKRSANLAPDTFVRFFERNPSYQAIFSKFASVPIEHLKENGDFLAQAYTVLAGVNVVVESLGTETLLDQQIKHLGIAHKNRNAKPWHFDELASALVATMKQELGSAFSAQAEDAWIDALNLINKAIVANLKDPYDVANSETHLTPNQVKVLKTTWGTVRDQREKIGQEAFVQLFHDNPSYKGLFSKFASVNTDDLPGNADFQEQIKAVVDRLDDIIGSLDNDLVLVGQLIYLGHTHFPRKVTREHFTKFGIDFVQVLGKRGVSEADQNVWKQVLAVLLEQVIDNLN